MYIEVIMGVLMMVTGAIVGCAETTANRCIILLLTIEVCFMAWCSKVAWYTYNYPGQVQTAITPEKAHANAIVVAAITVCVAIIWLCSVIQYIYYARKRKRLRDDQTVAAEAYYGSISP